MKACVILLGWTLCCSAVQAQSVSLSTARNRASRVLLEKFGETVSSPRRMQGAGSSEAQPYYLFSNPTDTHFVLIAGDERLPEVLGYGNRNTTTRTNAPELPESLSEWLQLYRLQLNRLSEASTPGTHTTTPVAPLLQDDWQQETPFNDACPYYMYDDGTLSTNRCPVGCVATALSQILHYYQYPAQLQDTLHGWSTDHYELTDILPGTPIDWEHIRNQYHTGEYSQQDADAVATLSLYCGMAVHMSYRATESGAYVYNVPEAATRVMGYQYAHYFDRSFYTPSDWNALLQEELTNGRPVLYAGYNMARSGHAFVVDGMDADGLYHVNWGYGGDYNGYFNIDVLNPFEPVYDETENGILEGFYCNQEAIVLHPESQAAYPVDSLEQTTSDLQIDSLDFLVPVTNKGYVPVDVYITNQTEQIRTNSVALLTWDADKMDSLTWNDISYVGLGGATFEPQHPTKVRLYAQFSTIGDKRFGLTFDGRNVMVAGDTLNVKSGKEIAPRFDAFQPQEITDSSAVFQLGLKNPSDTYWSVPLITYGLLCEDGQPELRHWGIPVLEPQASATETIAFNGLKPNTKYTLLLRYPWNVQQEYPFATTATAIETVEAHTTAPTVYYDLTGKKLPNGWQKLEGTRRVTIRKQGNKTIKIYNR